MSMAAQNKEWEKAFHRLKTELTQGKAKMKCMNGWCPHRNRAVPGNCKLYGVNVGVKACRCPAHLIENKGENAHD